MGMLSFCDFIVVVTATAFNIYNRVDKKGLNKNQAAKRIAAQIPITEKKKSADYVIVNNGNKKTLQQNVIKLTKQMKYEIAPRI